MIKTIKLRQPIIALITSGLLLILVLYYLRLSSQQSLEIIYQNIITLHWQDVLLWYGALPRLVAAIIAGSALALAGFLFQEASRNVLASPNLLGVGAGAHLALVIGLSAFPSFVSGYGGILFSLLGAFFAAVLVFGITYKESNPIRIIFAGVAISFSLSALAAILSLYFEQSVSGLFLWGAGDVEQQGWQDIAALSIPFIIVLIISLLFSPKIKIYALGDGHAKSLGISIVSLRWGMIALGVILTAIAVTLVGPISFIGLFVPNILRVLKCPTGKRFVLFSMLAGAFVLLAADSVTLYVANMFYINLPVGILTAMLGAPILLWALLRIKQFSLQQNDQIVIKGLHSKLPMKYFLALSFSLLLCAFVFYSGSSTIKSALDGSLFNSNSLAYFLYTDITLPRLIVAFIAGGALAVSGLFFQGVIQNPLASPEVLGISQGSTFSALILLLFFPNASWWGIQLSAFMGGILAFILVMLIAKKMRFQPLQLAMIGVCLGALYAALNTGLLAISGMQAAEVIRWLSGSVYGQSWQTVYQLIAILIVSLPLCYLISPWITLLAFGSDKAKTLGGNVYLMQVCLLLLATLQTSAVVASIGMLGFIGLMAPHLARMLGYNNPRNLVVISFFIGGLLALFSDWLANLLFAPTEIPAGLIAPIIVTVYLLWLLLRQR